MKKVITFLLAVVLLIGAAPETQAQKNKTLTTKEANELLQKIVGNWQVSHYETQFGDDFTETKGNAKFSKAYKGEYVHEQYDLEQADGSTVQGEGFLRFSEEQQRFEFVQVDKKGRSIVLMVGKWVPEYNALSFWPAKGERQWSSSINPNTQCVYLFKEDGTFMKIVRTFDKNKICRIVSQDHYAYPDVAKSN